MANLLQLLEQNGLVGDALGAARLHGHGSDDVGAAIFVHVGQEQFAGGHDVQAVGGDGLAADAQFAVGLGLGQRGELSADPFGEDDVLANLAAEVGDDGSGEGDAVLAAHPAAIDETESGPEAVGLAAIVLHNPTVMLEGTEQTLQRLGLKIDLAREIAK